MESWLPAIFGFGGVLIGSLFSLWLTKLQLNNADKRFERELLKAKEDAQRQRRWEVRSEPLHKLRAELAVMATKGQELATTARLLHTNIGTGLNDEQIKGLLDTASNEWNNYMHSGVFYQVLFTVDDKEIAEKAEKIGSDYRMLHFRNVNWQLLPPEQLPQTLIIPKQIRDEIREVQELINKRLEEL